MNTFAALSLLVVCAQLAAGAITSRLNGDGGLQNLDIVEQIFDPTTSSPSFGAFGDSQGDSGFRRNGRRTQGNGGVNLQTLEDIVVDGGNVAENLQVIEDAGAFVQNFDGTTGSPAFGQGFNRGREEGSTLLQGVGDTDELFEVPTVDISGRRVDGNGGVNLQGLDRVVADEISGRGLPNAQNSENVGGVFGRGLPNVQDSENLGDVFDTTQRVRGGNRVRGGRTGGRVSGNTGIDLQALGANVVGDNLQVLEDIENLNLDGQDNVNRRVNIQENIVTSNVDENLQVLENVEDFTDVGTGGNRRRENGGRRRNNRNQGGIVTEDLEDVVLGGNFGGNFVGGDFGGNLASGSIGQNLGGNIGGSIGGNIGGNLGGNFQDFDSGFDATTTFPTVRGGNRRGGNGGRRINRNGGGNLGGGFGGNFGGVVEEQNFPAGGLRRRGNGNGLRNAQRVIGSENAVGVGAGVEQGALARNSLRAGERNLDNVQALLQRKEARQQRLDAKAERQARRSERAKAEEAARLQAQSELNFETFEEAEDFAQLDAAANKETADRFNLAVQSENVAKEDAAIRENVGSKFDSATRFRAADEVDAENFANVEIEQEDEELDSQLLDAETAAENLLNANQEARREDEQFIDAQNFQQQQFGRGFQQSGFQDSGFGSSDFFGNGGGFNSPFGKK